MVKDNLITEWRKQRKAIVSQSDVGLRPLYDSTINSEEYQPSVECVIYPNESVICCKHGVKCSEYYNQEKKGKEISSLWPISELFATVSEPTNSIKTQTANSTASKPKGNYKKRATDSRSTTSNQYDNISVRCSNPLIRSTKTSSYQSLSKNNVKTLEKFPENASKLEILHRFYLGQRSRSVSISLIQFAQNFRLYHELPENVNNLDSLKQYAPLYIVFVNNDLEHRHLPVQECLMNGERRFFVECGDRNITPFETLEYLIRHYANTFAYTDSQGRKSRFPDKPVDGSSHTLAISNK